MVPCHAAWSCAFAAVVSSVSAHSAMSQASAQGTPACTPSIQAGTVSQRARLVRRVGEALAHAHAAEVISDSVKLVADLRSVVTITQLRTIAGEFECARDLMEQIGPQDSAGESAATGLRDAFRELADVASARSQLFAEMAGQVTAGEQINQAAYDAKFFAFDDRQKNVMGTLSNNLQFVPLESTTAPDSRGAEGLAMRRDEADSLRAFYGRISLKRGANVHGSTIFLVWATTIDRWLNRPWTVYQP